MGRMKEKAALAASPQRPDANASPLPPPRKSSRVPRCIEENPAGGLDKKMHRRQPSSCRTAAEMPSAERDASPPRVDYIELGPLDRATLKMAQQIALRGGQKSATLFEAGWQPACDAPARIARAVRGSHRQRSVEVCFSAPCRRCPKCLAIKARDWRGRIMAEVARAARRGLRSWVVALTFDPVHLAGIVTRVPAGTPPDRYSEVVNSLAWPHVSAWIKRLRVGAATLGGRDKRTWPPANFVYSAFCEFGSKTGRLHYHLVMHETAPGGLQKRQLEQTWRSFVHPRLIHWERGTAAYVTKYVSKALGPRVHASKGYGTPEPANRAAPPRAASLAVEPLDHSPNGDAESASFHLSEPLPGEPKASAVLPAKA